jgi:hypothetical protein
MAVFMKLISKRASLTILVLAVVCLLTRYVLCYWCGYYQKSFVLIYFQELLALFGLILILAALTTWIVSLIQKKQRIWTTALLAGLFALWGLKYVLPWPHDLILYGLRDGMLRNYGLDDIRRFARDFDRLPNLPEHNLAEPNKFYWNTDLAKTGLKEKYLFLAQCEAVVEADNIVHIDWGGFENHWGLSVAVDSKGINPPHLVRSNRTIRASDDIYFTSDY